MTHLLYSPREVVHFNLNENNFDIEVPFYLNRAEFSKWWLNEFKTVRFPPNGNVFDFYVDTPTLEMTPWVNRCQFH